MTKGDWKRRVDPRYEKEVKENLEKALGKKCRLPHRHDKECQEKENQ